MRPSGTPFFPSTRLISAAKIQQNFNIHKFFNKKITMATKKKTYLTRKEKEQLIEDANRLIMKIGKKKESITDSYERDFLEAARKAMTVVKYNLAHI